MPTYPRRGATSPAHSPLNAPSSGIPRMRPVSTSNQVPITTNPLFGRPVWSYVTPMQAPRAGPQPRLAQGTGRTTIAGQLPGNSAQLPGYLADNEYYPVLSTYQPRNRQDFHQDIPRTILTGDDGLHALNPTYRAHDFIPAQRFFSHMRSAPNWQVMAYPPDFRNMLAWQQAMRYRVASVTAAARPLDSSMYFLGYQTNPVVAGRIGQNTLGYMGSQ